MVKRLTRVKNDRSITLMVAGVLLFAYLLLVAFFLWWAVNSSLKGNLDFKNNIFGFPGKWLFDNYQIVFSNFYLQIQTKDGLRNVFMGEMFLNSALYTLGCSFMGTLIPCLVGYATSRFPFKFSKFIIAFTIVCMIIPIIGSLPSQLQMAKFFHLYDSLWGMWVMKGNFLSMFLLVFYAAFKSIPDAYFEAAKIDGAGNVKLLTSIALPQVKSLFFTIMLIQAIGFWNDYQTPMLFMPDMPTVAYGLYIFNGSTVTDLNTIPYKLAAAIEMMVPVLLLFVLFNKRIIGDITIGGMKE